MTELKGWIRGLLLGSLALNVLVIGLAIGAVLHGPKGPPTHMREPALPMTRAFDPDQQRALRRALRAEYERGPSRSSTMIADYRQALAVLRAVPFDADAMRTTLEAQGARAEARRLRGQDVLVAYLAAMSDEARAAYADRLEEEVSEIEERRARWAKKDGGKDR